MESLSTATASMSMSMTSTLTAALLNSTNSTSNYNYNSTSTANVSVSPMDAMDELLSEFLDKTKQYAITSTTTGSISFVCSSTIIAILLRSHAGLSKTYHRLLLGMCIGDIISSLAYMMSSAVMPSDVSYMVWNASGNRSSCDMQGFLQMFGIFVTAGYNCSLCLFYLAVVKYKKKDDYIKKYLEPWMHVIPIVIGLALAIAGLVTKVYNAGIANCFVTEYNPPHCIQSMSDNGDIQFYDAGTIIEGYDNDIPCGRGSQDSFDVFYYILLLENLGILPGILFVSMTMMYHEVLKTEKKMQQYGVGALRLRNAGASVIEENNNNPNGSTTVRRGNGNDGEDGNDNDDDDNDEVGYDPNASSMLSRSTLSRKFNSITSQLSQRFSGALSNFGQSIGQSIGRSSQHQRASTTSIVSITTSSRASRSSQNTRKVMYRALSYAMAYFATYLFPIIVMIESLVRGGEGEFQFSIQLYLTFVFHPLQGLFNFMVFMHPRLIMAKKKLDAEAKAKAQAQSQAELSSFSSARQISSSLFNRHSNVSVPAYDDDNAPVQVPLSTRTSTQSPARSRPRPRSRSNPLSSWFKAFVFALTWKGEKVKIHRRTGGGARARGGSARGSRGGRGGVGGGNGSMRSSMRKKTRRHGNGNGNGQGGYGLSQPQPPVGHRPHPHLHRPHPLRWRTRETYGNGQGQGQHVTTASASDNANPNVNPNASGNGKASATASATAAMQPLLPPTAATDSERGLTSTTAITTTTTVKENGKQDKDGEKCDEMIMITPALLIPQSKVRKEENEREREHEHEHEQKREKEHELEAKGEEANKDKQEGEEEKYDFLVQEEEHEHEDEHEDDHDACIGTSAHAHKPESEPEPTPPSNSKDATAAAIAAAADVDVHAAKAKVKAEDSNMDNANDTAQTHTTKDDDEQEEEEEEQEQDQDESDDDSASC